MLPFTFVCKQKQSWYYFLCYRKTNTQRLWIYRHHNVFILFFSFLSNAIIYQCTCSRNRKQIPIKLPVFVCYYGLSTRVCKIKSLFQVPKIKQKKAITAYFFHAVGRCNMYGKVFIHHHLFHCWCIRNSRKELLAIKIDISPAIIICILCGQNSIA